MAAATRQMDETNAAPAERRVWLGVAAVLAVTSVALWSVFRAADWYAANVSLPRYCADPAGTLALVGRILAEPRPAGDEARRPYMVAAKLLYLVPQAAAETDPAYLARLRQEIEVRCG